MKLSNLIVIAFVPWAVVLWLPGGSTWLMELAR